ncbi:interferon-inducible GTPase-domain-containing protein [Lanmaoa asiatica]|nr:interferon-inducible GTPase-domain-containing protein [Lanmaoa asiatica]
MGNVLVPTVGFAALALSHFFRRPDGENFTFTDIHARWQAEEAQRQAEQAARKAQELAEEIQRQANRDREQAHARQEQADQAAEKVERMKAQMEEAASATRHAQELSEAAASAAREEAANLAQEAEEERKRSRKMREDAERAMAAAKEKAERVQKAADEQRREAEAGKALAEEVARAAAEETQKAIEAERRLKEGIQPVVTPSPQEVAAAKRRIQYKEDCFHFAVAGISGSGKSSLVNAFRGLRSRDAGAAAVGVTETTLLTTRYPDANPVNPFVWYDIPGAGTLKCRDWQYFNDQGLYAFDCIIVLFDNRFTVTDIAILINAKRFDIPTYIVRSKADQHIRNIMIEKGYDSDRDDEEDVKRRNKLYKAARKQFIEETRESVRANLEDANLPDQRVYIVSNTTMLTIVLSKMPKKTIDEVDLINDLLNQAYSRRVARSDEITEVDSGSIGYSI